MWLVVPFLLLVVALPVMAFLGSRQPPVPASEWPPPAAMYAQIFMTQSIVAGMAYLAVRGAGLELSWWGQLRADALLVAAAFVLFMFWFSLRSDGGGDAEPSVGSAISPRKPTDWVLWPFALAAAAFTEEFAYRGVLFALTSRVVDGWAVNAVLGAALFGLAHKSQGWVGVWASAAFGFCMQVVVLRSGGLATAIAAHFAYDAGIELLSRWRTPRRADAASAAPPDG